MGNLILVALGLGAGYYLFARGRGPAIVRSPAEAVLVAQAYLRRLGVSQTSIDTGAFHSQRQLRGFAVMFMAGGNRGVLYVRKDGAIRRGPGDW